MANTSSVPGAMDRPSPFTIVEPAFKFVTKSTEPPARRSMTVGGLIHNLTTFADFYERASAEIERAQPIQKQYALGNRDANAEDMQRQFQATDSIERVRTYVLGRFGAELTLGTARRLLGDLIRMCGMTTDAAESLTLEAAMESLDAAGSRKESPAESNDKTSQTLSDPAERFRYHAEMAIAALKAADPENPFPAGIEKHVFELARTAKILGIPPPVEVATMPYPEGVAPSNPFMSDRLEGGLVIRYPGGEQIGPSWAAHARGAEMLVETAASAITALEQWLIHLDAFHSDEGAAVAGQTKRKRSTERGEGRAKLIPVLTKHHKYADSSCLNLEPIGNNELARQAKVSESTASAFFKDKFKGHTKYRALCRDSGGLAAALKLLNNEFSPHDLYGHRPADEDDRDDD